MSSRLAIGAGLAEWARARPSPLPRRYWWWRFPLELAFAFADVFSEFVWRVLLSLFRVDDRGHVHVHDRLVAIAVGVSAALLVLTFELVATYAYDRGLAHGMAVREKAYWSRERR